MAATTRYDPCLAAFWLIGGVVITITILALLSIAVPELADLSHLVSVATGCGVIEVILLTMAAALVADLQQLACLAGRPDAVASGRGPGRTLLPTPRAGSEPLRTDRVAGRRSGSRARGRAPDMRRCGPTGGSAGNGPTVGPSVAVVATSLTSVPAKVT